MRTLKRHKLFAKDLKRVRLTDNQFERMTRGITTLLDGAPLPPEYLNHPLRGSEWEDCWEFHLGGDMLLIYLPAETDLILIRIGTHNDLFKK